MARENKFNLISEDHITKKAKRDGVEYRVSLIKTKAKLKDGSEQIQYQVYFPRDVIFIYDLLGKRLKFYLDPQKKVIAWRVLENHVTLEELNTGREVKPFHDGKGSWTASITKLINNAKIDVPETRSKIPVKKYEQDDFGVKTDYWYIELR